MARLPNGDKPGTKTSLRASLDSLRATLHLPAALKFRKIPQNNTLLLITIHTSWLHFIKLDNLPPYTPNSYATVAKASAADNSPNKLPGIHIPDTLPTPDAISSAPL